MQVCLSRCEALLVCLCVCLRECVSLYVYCGLCVCLQEYVFLHSHVCGCVRICVFGQVCVFVCRSMMSASMCLCGFDNTYP